MILAANDLGAPVTPTPGGWSGSGTIAATAHQRKEDEVFLQMVSDLAFAPRRSTAAENE